ncbi:RteC domain-containing protein [Leeuwenhoekiella sp. NPDC079379]|uniref:RteC domain-containing protein n=1 Tax=Leeuwenhoekiella sp. NPDC079379 TaxID=3364122 RepID=UPI0037C541F3
MYTTILENFYDDLTHQVLPLDDPLKKAALGIKTSHTALTRLNELVTQQDFEDVSEEIHFFKHLKPCPMRYLIYYSEMRLCELRKPKAGVCFQMQFYKKELRKINKFFKCQMDFVRYMEQELTHLDHQYFTRNAGIRIPFTPLIHYFEYPEFSSSHDLLWAKIQAMYMLITYLQEALTALKSRVEAPILAQKHLVLLWSGSKTALVELIYALYASQHLNHGGSDLSTLVSCFENFFHIKLDGIYKTYGEIKSRKGSRTKFLEELILGLEYKMRCDDA